MSPLDFKIPFRLRVSNRISDSVSDSSEKVLTLFLKSENFVITINFCFTKSDRNVQFVEVSSSCVSNGVYFWTGRLERGFLTEGLRQK